MGIVTPAYKDLGYQVSQITLTSLLGTSAHMPVPGWLLHNNSWIQGQFDREETAKLWTGSTVLAPEIEAAGPPTLLMEGRAHVHDIRVHCGASESVKDEDDRCMCGEALLRLCPPACSKSLCHYHLASCQ